MLIKPIGILDSGVGGLTVWREIARELPYEYTVYVADSKNIPYGSKSTEEIFSLATRMIDFLITKRIKLLVIACNTITVTSIESLRQKYPVLPIIGTVPVVKSAALATSTGQIGILSTTQTANSQYQKDLITKFAQGRSVIPLGSDKLVPLIEQGVTTGEELDAVLREVLEPITNLHIDTLALACTHFPFIKSAIQRIVGNDVQILDSGAAIARQVRRVLANNNALAKDYSSSESEGRVENATNSSFRRASLARTIKTLDKYQFFTTGRPELLAGFVQKLAPQIHPRVSAITL